METHKLDQRIRALEPLARRRPGLFRLRALLLALAGYAYILAFPAFLLAAMRWLHPVLFFVGLPALIILAVALLARVRVPPPQGLRLDRADAPRLYRTAEELRRKLAYPHFHRLIVDEEFNAGVHQVPVLGLPGWERNYLRVGLPLLLGLSREQFRAVLAHEFCHLFGAHNRFSRWVHRLDQTWELLMERLEARGSWSTPLFRPFFGWYLPELRAHALALVRRYEFDADGFAADMVGRKAMAESLLAIEVKSRYLSEEFWPQVWRQAETQPEPPANPFREMAIALRSLPSPDRGQRWLERALAEETPPGASHPSLAERLAALGEPARLPAPLRESAAEYFLGAELERISNAVAQYWRGEVMAKWRAQHDALERTRSRRNQLEQKAAAGTLAASEAWELACFLDRTEGPQSALPFYSLVLEQAPNHPGASYALGRFRLHSGDEAGVELIEKAMKLDSDLVLPGCELLYNYFLDRGDRETARAWHYRALKHQEVWVLAQKERFAVSHRDRFYSAPLSAEQRAALAEALGRSRRLAAAWFVRKDVRYLPDKPCYVLAIYWRPLAILWNESALLAELIHRTAPLIPPALVVRLNDQRRLRNRIRNVPGACVYRRGWRGRNLAVRSDTAERIQL